MTARGLAGVAAGAALALAACGVGTSEPFQRQTFGFTFESEIGGWEGDGTDLDDPPVDFSVERSDEQADEGSWSVRLSLDNLNDAGKIWMEQGFPLVRGASYEVEIVFDFASADFGDVNLWTIIAGATTDDPETQADLTFRDDTGNGAGSDQGFVWQEKRYADTVTADGETGLAWIAIGVWGTFETERTYFVDDVQVTFTRVF